jgi:cobalt-zinc-cadmium efflux system membrane fusion protein
MKNKYVIISFVVVTALSLGAFFWLNADSEKKQVQVARATHAVGEEKEHDTHDHEEHGKDKSTKPDEHAQHDEHAEEEGEEGHGEEIIRLSDAELREFGVVLKTAQSGTLKQYIELLGEIVLNADRIAHVVPRVAGIVKEVRVTEGDQIKAGQLLAVIESRELADAKASYLAAIEREKLAQANFEREERLWEKKVTSEEEFLDARQALAEARIVKNSTEQQLHALGFTDDVLKELPGHPDATYTRFEIRAPLGGTIIEKHMTLGENVGAETDVFTIADLSTVWVNLNIYQKDLVSIRKGQTVNIEIGHGIPSAEGEIAWVGPQVDEETRTAKARIELPNPDGNLRPGLFVTAKVTVGSSPAGLVVPKSALQTFEGRTVVFVLDEDGFELKPVEIGRQNGTTVEILSGLVTGQTYAAEGSFTLKAQLSKGAFGDGHNH